MDGGAGAVDPQGVTNDGGVHTEFHPGMAVLVDNDGWWADAEVTFIVPTDSGVIVHFRIDVAHNEVVRGSLRLPEDSTRIGPR
ncbi:MAG: hypothetical protein JJLCMIEE_00928 [Acidimicrobiales bacterium]|nr:hypothetical protein [Acidimicrobiales bacterium]